MIIIQNTYNSALVYAETLDSGAEGLIRALCGSPISKGSSIRIMPDVHAGKGCAVGTTMTIKDCVAPGLVGVDIGCGMMAVKFHAKRLELQKLDKLIHDKIPAGKQARSVPHHFADKADLDELLCLRHVQKDKALCAVGTLGGGNHFIEIDEAADGTKYLVIHSGSRNLGKQVAEYYQNLAVRLDRGYDEYLEKREELIRTYKEQGRRKEIQEALKQLQWKPDEAQMPEDLCYLTGKYLEAYLHDVEICQQFARRNREKMAEILLERTGLTGTDAFHTIHNYIDTNEMILRKGAIAAHKGERVLIPINMRDGSILAVGKGNPEWNDSAPHGAGRLMSRKKAKETLALEEYRKSMEGIYTTSVNEHTLDEAPMAYKSLDDILDIVRASVDVVEVLRPVYNFKASE